MPLCAAHRWATVKMLEVKMQQQITAYRAKATCHHTTLDTCYGVSTTPPPPFSPSTPPLSPIHLAHFPPRPVFWIEFAVLTSSACGLLFLSPEFSDPLNSFCFEVDTSLDKENINNSGLSVNNSGLSLTNISTESSDNLQVLRKCVFACFNC